MIIPVLRDFFFPSEYSLLFSQMPPELPGNEKHKLEQTFQTTATKHEGFCSLERENQINVTTIFGLHIPSDIMAYFKT